MTFHKQGLSNSEFKQFLDLMAKANLPNKLLMKQHLDQNIISTEKRVEEWRNKEG